MTGRRRQRGAALITVLLVVALATVAAVDMSADAVFDRQRTGNRLALEQAHQLALGGERWSAAVLARAAEQRTGPDADVTGGDWPRELPSVPTTGGGQVRGRIADAQGRFNVNSLVTPGGVDPVAVSRFQRLLAALGLARTIAMATVDWIDRDRQPTQPGGAEDNFYLGLAEPYRVANRPMATASELRLVRGVDAESWRALAPHVTALPEPTPINVNTAGPVVLQAVVPGLDDAAAEDLADAATEDPFPAVGAFASHRLIAAAGIQEDGLAVRSDHFRSRVDVELGPLTYTLYSWLQREADGALRVLRRARTPN